MKKLILILLLCPSLAWPQAITQDGTTVTKAETSSSTSHTSPNITVSNFPNRVLICGDSMNFGTNTTEISVMNFNTSESMTKLVARNQTTVVSAYIWYRKNPSVTTATVTSTTSNSDRMVMGCSVYYNVAQGTDQTSTGTFRDSDGSNGSTGTDSGTLTVDTANGDLIFSVSHVGNNSTNPTNLVPGGSPTPTEQWDLADGAGAVWRGGGSTATATGSSATTSVGWTNSLPFAFVAAVLIPASSSGPIFKRYYDLLRSSLFEGSFVRALLYA